MNELEYRREYGFSVLERCLYHMRKSFRDKGIRLDNPIARFNVEMQAKELTDDILEIFQSSVIKANKDEDVS